ncbi:Acyl-coenzyme A:6-aminopenicillanic-acid-acyltransferase 40 kDa form [Wickerhamomyces ciferrii]|uniref:Acyl-coenzyme A:6-aminopenicillanic-acid-acyltransferase 40 kDa form n=1 Tax=Wickerhamomyces ciferrii (strain ATCC 14091 / BCRC 22168 / CBS 111 / JCM 3599 / NBRC 0793 / NRRL Y-1031 F-60-10) TaxID=1206466 RepID=K0KNI2_WICCF|nr:Acyl-coenzyme A:6-aminopenicillanic-acid-acyltransferase 40 kDa form [Wickerhamomyces ciferrii]CCH44556.1 Acyl-coenzyme A:6-aminopenicillanic-acid-acyltransferase 40 kDa form [Wickerhamomyces ciferrii]
MRRAFDISKKINKDFNTRSSQDIRLYSTIMPLDSIRKGEFHDSGKPYLKVSGTPYEIGFQHGVFASKQIHRAIEIYSKLYKDAQNVDWELARSRASRYEEPIKSKYPEIWEELEGISKGAGLETLDILALNTRSEITLVKISDGCTALAQRNKSTGEVWVGQNWDWIPEIDEATFFLEVEQPDKPSILILAEAGIIGKYGFNSAGVGAMLNAIPSNQVSFDGLPVHFALRKALEQKSVNDALVYLENNKVSSSANFLLADPKTYLTLEVSPLGNKVIEADEKTGAVWHTNHFLDKDLEQSLSTGEPILSSFERLDRVKELTDPDADANYDVFRERLSDIENSPHGICRIGTGGTGLSGCVTLYTIVINTNKKEGIITLGRPSDKSLQKYKLYFE